MLQHLLSFFQIVLFHCPFVGRTGSAEDIYLYLHVSLNIPKSMVASQHLPNEITERIYFLKILNLSYLKKSLYRYRSCSSSWDQSHTNLCHELGHTFVILLKRSHTLSFRKAGTFVQQSGISLYSLGLKGWASYP